jgi:hypothetical protein
MREAFDTYYNLARLPPKSCHDYRGKYPTCCGLRVTLDLPNPNSLGEIVAIVFLDVSGSQVMVSGAA